MSRIPLWETLTISATQLTVELTTAGRLSIILRGANFTTEPSNRSSVSGTINGSPYTFDLSDTMPTVTVGARTYYIAATFPGQINVKFKLL